MTDHFISDGPARPLSSAGFLPDIFESRELGRLSVSNDEESDSDDVEANFLSAHIDNPESLFHVFESDEEGQEKDLTSDEDSCRDELGQYFHPRPSSERNVDDDELHLRAVAIVQVMKKNMSRSALLGIISLYGKCRYTLEHYQHLVLMMQYGREEG